MVTINIHEAPASTCAGCKGKITTKDNPAPPLEDTIAVPRPPATGDYCLPTTNGQLADPPVWVPR